MKTWKISNISKPAQTVKVSVKMSSDGSRGLILQPNEFCVALPQLTAPMDSQKRKGFISINESYENPNNLELGVVYKQEADAPKPSKMEEAEKKAVEYIKKN